MKFRILRHPHQGVVIRAFDKLGGPPAYSIQYDVHRLRDPAIRWAIRQCLKRDLKVLREANLRRLERNSLHLLQKKASASLRSSQPIQL